MGHRRERRIRGGSTPVLNAVSVCLIVGSALLALISIIVQRDKSAA
jgi:spermidine/putrescine transport system permease protein